MSFCEKSITFCQNNLIPKYNLIIQDISYQILNTPDDFYCQPVTTTNTRLLYAWITLRDFVQNEPNNGLGSYTAKCYGRLVSQDGSPAFWQTTDSYLSTRWVDCTYKFSHNVDQKARIWLLAFPQSPLGTQQVFGDTVEGRIEILPHI